MSHILKFQDIQPYELLTTKTESSDHIIDMDEREQFDTILKKQKAAQNEHRLHYVPIFKNHKFVFVWKDGLPLSHSFSISH
jgi:hypothetical protein